MWRWIKRILISLVVLLLFLLMVAGFVRYQGVQYMLALLGGGYARPLPAVDAYPVDAKGGPNPCASGPISVVTYNTFNGSALVEDLVERFADGDLRGFKPWSQRVPEIRERIAGYDADLIGLQEMGWDEDIAAIVPRDAGYTLVSYKYGSFQYGDSALLFRSARFDLLDSGQLWYGPNPDLPLSYGFRRLSMLRYASWALLKEKTTGFTFLFVNTHFDNASANKEPTSHLFRQRITALAQGLPMVVTGDFNSPGNTERYGVFTGSDRNPPLLQNTQTLAKARLVHESHGAPPRAIADGETTLNYLERIDHILVGGPCPVSVTNWTIDTRTLKDGANISDHDLIAAHIEFGVPIDLGIPADATPVAATPVPQP
jgi:endonuclease/exonuclease/phosphatase family metal-dependent hydrolase